MMSVQKRGWGRGREYVWQGDVSRRSVIEWGGARRGEANVGADAFWWSGWRVCVCERERERGWGWFCRVKWCLLGGV